MQLGITFGKKNYRNFSRQNNKKNGVFNVESNRTQTFTARSRYVKEYTNVFKPGFRKASLGVPREIVAQIHKNFVILRRIPNVS
jgi:hypothetical protein